MRIDEFSAPADIDGTLDSTEQTRFMLFGFDLSLDAPEISSAWRELISFNSYITKTLLFDSLLED